MPFSVPYSTLPAGGPASVAFLVAVKKYYHRFETALLCHVGLWAT
jgi:hypothetical protein